MVNEFKSTTSTFKILKSSWGIWLKISGESIQNEEKENRFEINLNNSNLSKRELEYAKSGFIWIVPLIEKESLAKRTITIKEIKRIPTDYQEEGMFYGIAFWLCEHFEIEMPTFKYEFNRKENRYLFPDLKDTMK